MLRLDRSVRARRTFDPAHRRPVVEVRARWNHPPSAHERQKKLVGLVGPSGSGKSTLASLIPRFYDPDAGAVLIDGHDIREFTIRSLRRQIGFVLQETELFYAPVWQNIAYGQPDATREQMIEAARLAQAHEFIEVLPNGYDTMSDAAG